jgi:hypothetical protein
VQKYQAKIFLFHFEECNADACYSKEEKMSWDDATCPMNSEFMVPKNEAENSFIYKYFVNNTSSSSFWIDARTRGCIEIKLCGKVREQMPGYVNNLREVPAKSGCVEMKDGENGNWTVNDCNRKAFYICKYSK